MVKSMTVLRPGNHDRPEISEAIRRFVLLCSGGLFLYLLFMPLETILRYEAILSLSVLTLTLGIWITEYVPMAVGSLVGCFMLYFLGRLYNYPVLISNSFAGFSASSVWFVFSGLIIGSAMAESGLARRIALKLMETTGNSYKNLVLGILITSVAIVFLIPSTDGRTVVLMSFILGLAQLKKDGTDNGFIKGLSVMVPISCSILGIGLLASVSSITAVGLIEKYLNTVISYTQWMIMFLPAEVLTCCCLYLFVIRFFPADISQLNGQNWAREELKKIGPWSTKEKKAAFWTCLAVLLWLTGSITGLRADVVAMACALALLLPVIGVMQGKELSGKVNWLISPIFLGGAFSIVECLNKTGMLNFIGENLFQLTISTAGNAGVLPLMLAACALAVILHIFTAHSSMLIASFLPLILQWSANMEIKGVAIGLSFVWGSQIEFLVYQASSLTIAYGYGTIKGSDIIKLAVPLGIVQLFGGITISYLWWRLLGII